MSARVLALFAVLLLCIEQSPVLAQDSSPLAGFVPSAAEEERAREAALEQSLSSTLSKLRDVREARVHLDLPSAALFALDEPLPKASGSVLLVVQAAGPSDDEVQKLVRGAAQELAQASLAITRTRVAASAEPKVSEPLVSVGPFRVSQRSERGLRLFLGASLAANVLLATFLLARLRRSTP